MALDFDRIESTTRLIVRLLNMPGNSEQFELVALPFTIRCERCGCEFIELTVDTLPELVAHVKAGCI